MSAVDGGRHSCHTLIPPHPRGEETQPGVGAVRREHDACLVGLCVAFKAGGVDLWLCSGALRVPAEMEQAGGAWIGSWRRANGKPIGGPTNERTKDETQRNTRETLVPPGDDNQHNGSAASPAHSLARGAREARAGERQARQATRHLYPHLLVPLAAHCI